MVTLAYQEVKGGKGLAGVRTGGFYCSWTIVRLGGTGDTGLSIVFIT